MKTAVYTANILINDVPGELIDALRSAAQEKASRLFDYSLHFDQVRIDLTQDPAPGGERRFVATAQIEFGGPALLVSVTDRDPARAIDFLFEKIHSQLRRQTTSARLASASAQRGR